MEKKKKKNLLACILHHQHIDKPSQLMVMRVGLWLRPAIDNGYFWCQVCLDVIFLNDVVFVLISISLASLYFFSSLSFFDFHVIILLSFL
jgi:hypothetical protein